MGKVSSLMDIYAEASVQAIPEGRKYFIFLLCKLSDLTVAQLCYVFVIHARGLYECIAIYDLSGVPIAARYMSLRNMNKNQQYKKTRSH